MIKNETNLVVADNSGARVVRVIRLLGGSTRTTSYIGDLIKCSVKEASPHATVKKGEIYKAVIIRSKFGARRADGSHIKFDDNAVVLVKDDGNPIGSRIFGPVARELREQSKYSKILSLAEEVL